MIYALTNALVFDGSELLNGYSVLIENGHITSVVPNQQVSPQIRSIDLNGSVLSAGFVDLQLNGCGGVMLNGDFSTRNLEIMHQSNIKSGTTNFMPTLITTDDEEMQQAVEVSRAHQRSHGSVNLGLHLEGPYLSVDKKGIHSEALIRQLNQQRLRFLLDNSDAIKKVTLAPEHVELSTIAALKEAGILVSLGHTNANYQQASEAINAGAGFATHLFNAMSPMTGREPGVVGAIFDHNLFAGIIVDGHHVDDANVRIAKRLLRHKLCLVTDATAAAGADITSFDFVGRKITVQDGICFGDDGTLGGSALTMIQAVKNCVQSVGLSMRDSLRMASLYPATAINRDKDFGRIKAGYTANLTAFDQDFNVTLCISDGQLTQF
ncbi:MULTISPECIES: N-acetylglucosamine-6-phosphate deacetylase [unclassified Agarivorans]|nr:MULTISPECIES: N-acetylglucosamine-6-phosphate deacetylase [unclassified Agarivorans]MDO6684929.1 N-acetylglucosamine-6-phosphate deacetylase [Agarivorans sp. 3_MG-2023]MDO6714910.1 N-acetylglucosamine-6-phosphate deacetylase [Agarivorans sp. 2_MG-2023]MDO6764170.1 N-acetylglucosamine-6-phosphate deacetylase [Agarivorans sp. 1_MG-2023]GDY27572.1 N-acetylglucosamine-6-phosphate deacetylase [Agarivorans sp. Toyoura001]